MIAATPEAYDLIHQGAITLSELEANGIRVDVDRLHRMEEKVKTKIEQLEEHLTQQDEFKTQRKKYGLKTNLNSRQQLAGTLADMGYPTKRTAKGNPQLQEEDLELIGTDYVTKFIRLSKFNKLLSTYIAGVKRELVNGFIHPFYNLHIVRSYRSSSDSPNFQNFPAHDPLISKIIRSCFIPRDGHYLVDLDFKSLEVMVACCLSGDEKLIYDATQGDMHRDMAAEIFILDPDEVTKTTRFVAKNDFVFAEFYGDYHKKIAPNIWNDIDRMKLTTADGVPMKEHLLEKGIENLGNCDPEANAEPDTLEYHLGTIENRFWNQRFTTYRDWREERFREYYERGYFDLVTGFVCRGPMAKKNGVINYPIQGPAFHCLLWCLNRIVREMKKRKMKSMMVGQIHDSGLGDIHRKELDDYLELAIKVITIDLPKHWDWITVPFSVEGEIGKKNWYEKEELELPVLAS